MSKRFSHLMSPGYIANVEIPNRIVSVPMGAALADPNGFVTPRILAYYEEKAKGGPGLIIVEATYPDQIVSKGEEGQLGAYSNDCGPGLALLAKVIHDWGVRCAVQINHQGEQQFLFAKYWSASPSDGVEDFSGIFQLPLRGLTVDEIHEIIQSIAMAALRVKNAGFDMVEVHAAHGHLYSMFLSPFYNKRTDEYGGSLENRMRIVVETVQAVQQMCGPDFPILVRLVGQDHNPVNPITLDEGIATAKKMEEIGVAAIDLSGGSNLNPFLVTALYMERGLHAPDAAALKKAGVKIPIIVAGGITTPDLAEEIIAKGQADFAGLGRPTLADPAWARKIEAGTPEDIIPCIRCTMGCIGTMADFMAGKGIGCSVNPRTAMEDIRKVAPLEKKKKVAVIGGGPGGMEAARLATLRGHDVTLYEKRQLGGALHVAGWDKEFKPDIQFLLDYYKTQMKKLKVKVIKEEATVDTIVKGKYDVAIVATGAVGQKLKVPGSNKPYVYTDLQVTGGKDKELGKTVIVVGGGAIATEIAVSQAMKGKKVIMTTRKSSEFEVADDESAPNRMCLMDMMKTYNVQINLGLTLKEVTDDGIISVDQEGKTHKFKGDSVVICAGYLPNNTLVKALKGKVKEVRAIGDCVKPRLIGDAILEGWLAGNQI